MSAANQPRFVGRIDGRTNLDQPKDFQITFGARDYTFYSMSANGSATNQNNINWQLQIPSSDSIISRQIFTQVTYQLNFNSNAPAGSPPILNLGNTDGPRALPTASVVQSVNHNINGVPVNTQMEPVLMMARYWISDSDSKDILSGSTTFLDKNQDYAAPNFFGQDMNALGPRGASDSMSQKRGATTQLIVNQNTYNSAQVTMTVTEPLFVPGLLQKYEGPGMAQIKTFTVTLNMQPNLLRLWCRAPPATNTGSIMNPASVGNGGQVPPAGAVAQPGGGTAIANPLIGSVNINGIAGTAALAAGSVVCNASILAGSLPYSFSAPQIIYMAMTPSAGYTIPTTLQYDFSQWTFNTNDQPRLIPPGLPTSVGGAGTSNQQTAAQQLSVVPDEIFICVAPLLTNKYSNTLTFATNAAPATSMYLTDTYARIDALTLNFNNTPSLLLTTQNFDRFRWCKDNGFQGSYDDFQYFIGSIICIRPGKDFGLAEGVVPGMTGTWLTQFTVSYNNVSDCYQQYSIYVICRTYGAYTIENGQIYLNIGLVTDVEAKQAKQNITGEYISPWAARRVGMGGEFFDSIQKLIKVGGSRPRMSGRRAGRGMRGGGLDLSEVREGIRSSDAEREAYNDGGIQADDLLDAEEPPAETQYVRPKDVRKRNVAFADEQPEEQPAQKRRTSMKFS